MQMKNKQIDGIYVRQQIHKTQPSTKSFRALRLPKNRLPLWLGLLLVLIISSLLRSPFHANAFSGGDGTVGNPFLITTPAQLASLTSYLGSSHSGKYFQLENDLDLNISPYNTGNGWTPIGNSSNNFYGKFDGNGKTISGLYISSSNTATYQGLFGFTNGAIIEDLTITNASINSSQSNVGVLAGRIGATTTVTNVSTSGTVTSTLNNVGGLVGYSDNSNVTGSTSSANVTGNNYVGGLFGYLNATSGANSTVTSSGASGNVRGNQYGGGFAGGKIYATISNSYATGSILGDSSGGLTNDYMGGFIGTNCYGTISSSYATGDLYGDNELGGFVGLSHNCGGTITNSYARGDVYPSVSGTGGSFMRYIYLGTVSNSYSTGLVDGQTNAGFIYYDHTCSSCVNNFWDTESSGQATGGIFSGGRATGKTTTQMKSVATFTTTGTTGLTTPWDFVGNPNNDVANNDYWNIDTNGVLNDGYPYLNWQSFNSNATPSATSMGPTGLVDGSWSTDTTPTLAFTTADANGSDTVQYAVEIDDTANFSSPVVSYTSALAAPGAMSFTVGQATGSGTYTTGSSSQTLADRQYYWRVKAIDNNAAESSYVVANNGSVAFGVDTTAPPTPTLSGASPTNNTTPTLSWTSSSDAGAGLYSLPYDIQWSQSPSFDSLTTTSVDAINYEIYQTLSPGTWYFRVRVRDDVQNVSDFSSTVTVTIDTTPPAINTLSPNDDNASTPIAQNLSINFTEEITKNSGTITIHKQSDDSVVEAINILSGQVSVNGSTATINPAANLEIETAYYVHVTSGSFQDTAGNQFAGITTNTDWNFAAVYAPFVLCEQPQSTSSSITGNCEVEPAGAWGTTTWEARYKKVSDVSYTSLNLANTSLAQATVSGLAVNTTYYLEFRFTNDYGTGDWSRLEITTTEPSSPKNSSVPTNNITSRTNSTASSQATEVSAATESPIVLNNYTEFLNGAGKTLSLQAGQVIYFELNDEQHSITVKEIADSYAVVTVASTPTDLRIDRGNMAEHDVDGDGKNDIKLQLSSTQAGIATISFAMLVKTTNSTSTTPPQSDSSTASNLSASFPIGSAWILLLVAIGGLIIFVFLKRENKPR
ncbi:MAG: hypothetical protein QG658_643 [Patescibacteria group bacterium]|nr:hypothetical protein [Patescibacteria group bacterium]